MASAPRCLVFFLPPCGLSRHDYCICPFLPPFLPHILSGSLPAGSGEVGEGNGRFSSAVPAWPPGSGLRRRLSGRGGGLVWTWGIRPGWVQRGGRTPCGKSVSMTKPGTEALTATEIGIKTHQTSDLALRFCKRLVPISSFVLHSSTWHVKVVCLL